MHPIGPAEIQWFEGELPDVHLVPKNCSILAWFVHDFGSEDSKEWQDICRYNKGVTYNFAEINGSLRRIEMVHPKEDSLNPLKWCDSSCMPVGYCEKVKCWAWIVHPLLIGKVLDKDPQTPQDVKDMVLWAWVGEDEFGSGEVGLKQARTNAGYVPLVACKDNKVNRDIIRQQLQQQVNAYGKPIRLCRFTFVGEEEVIIPNVPES